MSNPPCRIAALVSGGGSNLEAILQAQEKGDLPASVVLVLSSRAGVPALERARNREIPTSVVERKAFESDAAFDAAVMSAVKQADPDVICLAGYLRRLSAGFISAFRGRILNIHPALLPKYGGAGMYGRHVHEAVLAAGDVESGCTVHLVDEEFDHGPALAQVKVPVLKEDSADTLARRVLEQEHRLYPLAIKAFCEKIQKDASQPT